MSDFRTDYENFQKIWDKAQGQGIFDDAKKPVTPAHQNDPSDYFDKSHRGSPSTEVDTEKYWAKLHNAAKGRSGYVDPIEEEEDEDEDSRIDEDAETVAVNPNPVHLWTLGKDQDLVANSLGFTSLDFLRLEQMKKDLHDMISKVNEAEGRGNPGQAKSVMSKIEALKDRIDDLSDTLSYERLKMPRTTR